MRYTWGVGTYAGIPVRIHATFPLVLLLYAVLAAVAGTWRDGAEAVLLLDTGDAEGVDLIAIFPNESLDGRSRTVADAQADHPQAPAG